MTDMDVSEKGTQTALRRRPSEDVAAHPDGRSSDTAGAGASVTIVPTRSSGRWRPPRALRRTIGPLLVLLIWYVSSATGLLPPVIMVSPTDTAIQAWTLIADCRLLSALGASATRVLIGFLIGSTVAVVLALSAGLFRLGEDLVDSTVGMLRTVPWVGLTPLFVVWLGIDEAPKIALVALGVSLPLYFNLYGGIRGVDTQLVESGTALGLGRLGMIRHVILPGALPGGLVGLRYSLGTAWLALVFAEQINATSGIGYLMRNAQQYYQLDVIVVCLVLYAILGLLCDLTVRLVGRWLLSWRASFEGV